MQEVQLQEQGNVNLQWPTYSDIVANDCGQGSVLCVMLCYMDYTVILDVAVFPNLDAVDITCKTLAHQDELCHITALL